MNFQIVGLSKSLFAPLVGLSDAELAQHRAVRQVAVKSAASRFPCRVSLRDAETGESVLLVNFEHLDVSSPYRSRYAVYVRETAADVQLAANEIPEVMQHRPLSLRSFDTAGMLLDADLTLGGDVVPTIERLLGSERVDYLHVHNAKHGCFVARVDRA
jgi:Protein of unknown function (DUF1203)